MSEKYWADRPPSLQERRASSGETIRHRSRKNTRRWCRGKEGVEHDPVVVLRDQYRDWKPILYSKHGVTRRLPCWYPVWWPTRYFCAHRLVCKNCGKVLREGLGPDCPDRPRQQGHP